ncbi:hypothetical protein Pint_25865 [Pistacia integerrima]|uniref:Uncharacterized protein n=1 Tax=Pistacia integerrima TaxID=434235 RepID=A0ACC0YD43_9ROSI|nr:hypothetical protein Pint_25865 [Pistacia integerrima]
MIIGTQRTSSVNAEVLLHVSNIEKEILIRKLLDDDFTKVGLGQKAGILHKDITKHDSKTEEEHDVGSLESALRTTENPGSNLEDNGIACCSSDIIDVAAPPLEPLTGIFESDQEEATVDETTEVRTLLVEETADEPAMALEPGLAPISSSFQDQDSAPSVQPTAPPLTMIPSLPDNSAKSTASLPTSPPDISNIFLIPLVAPHPSFQASAGSHASSLPSTNLESEGAAQDSFSTIGNGIPYCSNDIIDVAAPPLEPMTSIFESDQEAATFEEAATKEKEDLRKQLQQKNECIASS